MLYASMLDSRSGAMGFPLKSNWKLQLVQNTVAQAVMCALTIAGQISAPDFAGQ